MRVLNAVVMLILDDGEGVSSRGPVRPAVLTFPYYHRLQSLLLVVALVKDDGQSSYERKVDMWLDLPGQRVTGM